MPLKSLNKERKKKKGEKKGIRQCRRPAFGKMVEYQYQYQLLSRRVEAARP
jgi:hypothetical protein